MALALGVTFTANFPFDVDRLDWSGNDGIAAGMGTLLGYGMAVPGVPIIIREGASREYDRTWDFVATLTVVHFTFTCLGAVAGRAWADGRGSDGGFPHQRAMVGDTGGRDACAARTGLVCVHAVLAHGRARAAGGQSGPDELS